MPGIQTRLGLLFLALAAIGLAASPPVPTAFQLTAPVSASFMGSKAPIALTGLTGTIILLWTFNYLFAFALGAALLRIVFPSPLRVSNLWFAGFWLGYLGIVTLSRIWSLIFEGPWFYGAMLCSTLLLTAWLLRQPSRLKIQWMLTLPVSGLFLVFLPPILAHQIYMGDFRWNGHGTEQYAMHTLEWFAGRLPILRQHYDEVLFHHFLVGPAAQTFDPVIPWWLTLGLVKLSVFAFILMFFQVLGLSAWRSRIATLFLFLGTSSILPWNYYLQFDSANPLAFTVHSGRLIGIPFAALFILWLKEKFAPPPAAQIILGLALMLTPFSNFVWLPVLWIIHYLLERTQHMFRDRSLALLGIVPAFYIYPSKVTAWLNAIALVALIRKAWRDIHIGRFRHTISQALKAWPFKPLAITALIALLLLGNILAGLPPGRLFAWALDLEQVSLLQGGFHLANIGRILKDHRELLGIYNIYNRNPWYFVTVYGFAFWLITSALLEARKDIEIFQRWLQYLVFGLASAFLVVDFVGVSTKSWLLTRLLELPFYLCIILSLVILLTKARPRWIIGLLGVFSLAPLIGTQRIQQILANFELFKSLLSSM